MPEKLRPPPDVGPHGGIGIAPGVTLAEPGALRGIAGVMVAVAGVMVVVVGWGPRLR